MSRWRGLRRRAAGPTSRQPVRYFSSLDQPLGLQPDCVVETKALGERGMRGRVETDRQECRCERQREIARARNSHQKSFTGGRNAQSENCIWGGWQRLSLIVGASSQEISVCGFSIPAAAFGDGVRHDLTGLRAQTIQGWIARTSEERDGRLKALTLATRSRQVPQQSARQM
jgi:hypothetical protein